MEFTLTHPDSGIKDILVIFDGVPYEADSNHSWWDEIVYGCWNDDPRVLDLFPIRLIQRPSEEVPFSEDDSKPRWLPHDVDCEDDDFAVDDSAHDIIFGGVLMNATSAAISEQDRAEGNASFDRPPVLSNAKLEDALELERKTREVKDWETLFGVAMGEVEELRKDLLVLVDDLDYELERSDFLEGRLRHYAGHAWNDISRELEARWDRVESVV